MNVCVWMSENSPSHLCLWVRERTHLPFALPSNHMLDNLLANRILDGRTDPDTPKRIPITLSDTLTLKDTLTLSDTHYTEWYPLQTHPRGYPLHCKPILQAKWSGFFAFGSISNFILVMLIILINILIIMFPSSSQWVLKFSMCSPRVRVRENSPPSVCPVHNAQVK